MLALTRHQIFRQYGLLESTFNELEALGLVEVEPFVVRGALRYEITKEFDMLLRVAQLHYSQLAAGAPRILPMHRLFLYLGLTEGIEAAEDLMRWRSIISPAITKKHLEDRWFEFWSRAPEEVRPFIKRETDEETPAVIQMLKVLDIYDAYVDPEITLMEGVYDDLVVRAHTEALFIHKPPIKEAAELINAMYDLSLTESQLRNYRRYYFDVNMLTKADIRYYISHQTVPEYAKMLERSLQADSLLDFLASVGFTVKLDAEREFQTLLDRERSHIIGPVAGEVSRSRFRTAVYNIVKITEAMMEIRSELGTQAHEDDLIRLRHDASVNKMILSLDDIPEKDRDALTSGPISTPRAESA